MAKTIIRPARFTDVFAIESALLESIRETASLTVEFEKPYVYQWIMELIRQGTVIVAEKDSEIVGVIALEKGTWPWHREHEFFGNPILYVHPDHRYGGVALSLVKHAKGIASAAGVDLVLDVSWGDDALKKQRFLEIHGGERIGGKYLFRQGGAHGLQRQPDVNVNVSPKAPKVDGEGGAGDGRPRQHPIEEGPYVLQPDEAPIFGGPADSEADA
ncbi:MAG: GNAT family N-acetyltransferase [Xanthomonadales bacterium]|nr:GNAT family N-acetyltransferase [Xanthomonadales bacterium]